MILKLLRELASETLFLIIPLAVSVYTVDVISCCVVSCLIVSFSGLGRERELIFLPSFTRYFVVLCGGVSSYSWCLW